MINLLLECKQALINRDAIKCYNSGTYPCECTICKIDDFIIKKSTIELKLDSALKYVDIYVDGKLSYSRDCDNIYYIFKALLIVMDLKNKDFGLTDFIIKSKLYQNKELERLFLNNNYKITIIN